VIAPGEIYIVDLEEGGRRPVLVVSRGELNRGRTTVGVLITSSRFAVRAKLPNCVPFHAGQFGLTRDCVAQCENLVTIDVARFDLTNGPVGKLNDQAIRDVIRAIGHVIEADCEPI
jgi:mRNA-degrading endonuclease toxin of MazEF toxin-antitoxin module